MNIRAILIYVLLTYDKPSTFFESLTETDLNAHFKELNDLKTVKQNPKNHPEGSVWNHTMMVIDEAAKLKYESSNQLAFMLAALCHDFGKFTSTEIIDGQIRAYNHHEAGIPLARTFLTRFQFNNNIINYVCNMVGLHMKPILLIKQKSSDKAFRRMFKNSIMPTDLILLTKADQLGRGVKKDVRKIELLLNEKYNMYKEFKQGFN